MDPTARSETGASLRAIARALARHERRTLEVPGRRQAAVLLLCYERDEEPWIVLTKRAEDLRHHRGEISFPGGARDATDPDLFATALRETHEELGIEPETVRALGALDDYPTYSSSYVVAPFVGAVDEPQPWRPSEQEIAQVIELPLRTLWLAHSEEHWERDGVRFAMHLYDVDGHRVWGLTAFILHRFLHVVAPELGYVRDDAGAVPD